MGKAWLYRKKITVNCAKESDQDLTDFPLLIVVKAVALRSLVHGGHVVHEDGADLYFADPGGTRLDHELEHYDPATGVLKAWVRIPQISPVRYTEIWLCYGQTSGSSPDAVWDSHYTLVRHLDASEGETTIVPHADHLYSPDAITVEVWCYSGEFRSDTFQALVSKWSLRATMDAFESYDAGETDGLCTKGYYGAVHAGDYIYYVPRLDDAGFHTRMLRHDTQQEFRSPESWSAFDVGHLISYQSAAYDGRAIYFAPGYEDQDTSGQVLRYDTQGPFDDHDSYALYNASSTSGLVSKCYDGACFDGRYVYFAPLDEAESKGIALRHDTQGDFLSPESWAAFDAKASGLQMCVGVVFDGRYLYYVPYGHSVVLRYDGNGVFQDAESWTAYDATYTAGLRTRGYDGACFDGRYVYFIPFWDGENPGHGFHARLLRYDTLKEFTNPAAWDASDGGASTSSPNPGGFNGAAFDGRYIYCAPWREDSDETDTRAYTPHGKVLRYDTTDPDASFILKYTECGHNGGLGAALPGPTFSINTANGVLNVRANEILTPGWHHVAGVYVWSCTWTAR